jgi:hypothetical protein
MPQGPLSTESHRLLLKRVDFLESHANALKKSLYQVGRLVL